MAGLFLLAFRNRVRDGSGILLQESLNVGESKPVCKRYSAQPDPQGHAH